MDEKLLNDWDNFLKGRNDSLSAIYECVYSKLFFTGFFYFKNEDDARDVVGEVFLKLLNLNSAERLRLLPDRNGNIEGYLKVMTKHKCLDRLKVKNNRFKILNSISKTSNRYINKDNLIKQDYMTVMELLSPQQLTMLKLHFEGYKNNEIAESLKLSPNTVKNTLVNAKKKVRNFRWFFRE